MQYWQEILSYNIKSHVFTLKKSKRLRANVIIRFNGVGINLIQL